MSDTFRGSDTSKQPEDKTHPASMEGNSFRSERTPTIQQDSPEAIMTGVILHSDSSYAAELTPTEFRRMPEALVTALGCDLTGDPQTVKNRMMAAGLSAGQVEDIWISSKNAFEATQKFGSGDFELPAVAYGRAHQALLNMPAIQR